MVRTFVAIDLPEEIRERARESQEILRPSGGRLAIVDPANLHITVKFLGGLIRHESSRSSRRSGPSGPTPSI
jgi:2''-5'' RNA ligase